MPPPKAKRTQATPEPESTPPQEQILDGVKAALAEAVETLRQEIPKGDDLVRQAVDVLNAKAEAGLQDIRSRIEQMEAALGQAPTQTPEPSQDGTQPSSDPLTKTHVTVPGGKSYNLGDVASVLDLLLDRWVKFTESRVLLTDPIALAFKIRQDNPIKAAIAGQILYQDPLVAHLPQIVAQVGSQSYVQGLRTRQAVQNPQQPGQPQGQPQGGSTWPGYGIPSGGSPSWYGGPSPNPPGQAPEQPPPSAVPRPEHATMSGLRERLEQWVNDAGIAAVIRKAGKGK